MKKEESYNNLIDVCLKLEEEESSGAMVKNIFSRLLVEYFYKKESEASRNLEAFIGDVELPGFLDISKTIFDVDIGKLKGFVEGNTINDSLSGTIMLSSSYLKVFYTHHAPSFSKLPEDVKFELIDKIKAKNSSIVAAFEKMKQDREADRDRKVITLVALMIKNIHRKSGYPLNKLQRPAGEILGALFHNPNGTFTASSQQMADLNDDTKIKELVKTFFIVKQYKEITGLADLYRAELERFKRRTVRAQS